MSTITQTIFATKEQLIQQPNNEAASTAINNLYINRAPFDFKLHKEEDRFRTFETVEFMLTEYKSQLALTGFYYKCTQTLQCFFCKVIIKLPESALEEDVINYHLQLSSACPLINGRITTNVPIDSERLQEILQSTINRNTIAVAPVSDVCGHGQRSMLARRFPPTQYIHYECIDRRLSSFDDWPTGLSQTKEDMANAGFFYSGSSDRVICYSCGIKLKEWEPHDVPLIEHAKWLKSCEFMSLKFGENYIQSIKSSLSGASNCPIPTVAHNENNNNYPLTSSSSSSSIASSSSSDVRANSICKICLVNASDILFQPCNHCATCADCSLKLYDQKCPVCRSPIITKSKIYFS